MKSLKLVPRKVESPQLRHHSQRFEQNSGVDQSTGAGKQVRRQVEFLKQLKAIQTLWKSHQVVARKIESLEFGQLIQVSDRLRVNHVVAQVERLKAKKLIGLNRLNLLDVVVLKVYFCQALEVSQLFQPHVIVAQVQRGEVLKVAQVFFDHFDYFLADQLGSDGFVG